MCIWRARGSGNTRATPELRVPAARQQHAAEHVRIHGSLPGHRLDLLRQPLLERLQRKLTHQPDVTWAPPFRNVQPWGDPASQWVAQRALLTLVVTRKNIK